VLTACTAWLLLARKLPAAWVRPGLAAAVLLAWGSFALLRVDGLDSGLHATVRWRWTPSPEDLFLSEHPAGARVHTTVVAAAAWVASRGRDDGTGFRGRERDGVLRGVRIATDWEANPPRLRWRRRVGPAWSSLVVLGDRLFTQEQRGDQEAVVCYDAATGRQLWLHGDAARFSESVSGAGPRATPTYADGRVYTLGATGLLNCLDAATGSRLWRRDVAAEAGAKLPMWGFSGSPLVTRGLVVVYAGGEGGKGLLAYRAASGEPVWAAPAGGSSYSSPQRTALGGAEQILMLNDLGLTA